MNPQVDLRRTIGFWGGTALIVGTMIGGGIFRVPGSIASVLQSPPLILGLWLFFGIVTICGALTLAELATMLPQTGGTYVYLRAAYGDGAAFVFGWLYLLAAIPSGMAALAVFLGELIAGASQAVPFVAVGAIVLLSAANIVGVRLGSVIQNIFAVVKVAALSILIVWALSSGKGDAGRWLGGTGEGGGLKGLAAAAQSVMFTYNGWVYVSLIAGELISPERSLKRIILLGTGTVIAIYLLANLAYLYLLPIGEMAGKGAAIEAMTLLAGPAGGKAIGFCIMASVFGSLNGIILSKARVAFALARDGLTFGFLGRAHPRFATPYVSILIQGAVAVALILVLRDPQNPRRLFDRLTAYFVVVEWLALLFAIAAVFVLRRKMPEALRPYRTPAYPWVPLIFVVGTAAGLTAIVASAVARKDYAPLFGLGIVLAGFPVYRIWRRSAAINH